MVEAPDALWLADITAAFRVWGGFLYLATVSDMSTRRVRGWSMANYLRAELVIAALIMAAWQRRPSNVIHHSDQSCQYTSIAFGDRCRKSGVLPSIGLGIDAYDNPMYESFFAILEYELIDRTMFNTQAEARMATFEFIKGWYNPHRRHFGLGYKSPVRFKRLS